MSKLTDTLYKIDNWLTKNASQILEYSLNKGASEKKLKALEKEIDKELPEAFKEMYRWHNGMSDSDNIGNLFYGMSLLSVDSIIHNHKVRMQEYRNFNPKPLRSSSIEIEGMNMHNPNWIPFCSDRLDARIQIDLAPTIKGTYGQIIFIDEEYDTGILLANSIEEFVEGFAKDLENGLYRLDPDALEEDEHFLAVDPSIDVVNWFETERWKYFE